MDAKDLRGIGESLAKSLIENKNIEAIAYGISRVVSYLESEQTKRKELETQIVEHTKAMEEFKKGMWRLDLMEKQAQMNGKMLRTVLTSVACLLVIEVLKLAFGHK